MLLILIYCARDHFKLRRVVSPHTYREFAELPSQCTESHPIYTKSEQKFFRILVSTIKRRERRQIHNHGTDQGGSRRRSNCALCW